MIDHRINRKNVEIELLKETSYPVPWLIDENDYLNGMTRIVEPTLDKYRKTGYMGEERRIYYELYPQLPNKGTVLFCHGFTETSEKLHELIFYFIEAGFQAAVIDARGHGKSFREGKDPSIIHIDHFDDYAKDLHKFLVRVASKEMKIKKDRLYLFGHSMGGCIAARFCQLYPDLISRAVLSSPMIGINFGSIPEPAAKALCTAAIAAGRGRHPVTGQQPFSPMPDFSASACSSEARFLYYHDIRVHNPLYQTTRSDYFWGREAIRAGHAVRRKSEIEKIKADILLVIAGRETLVSRKAQEEFIKGLKKGKAVLVPDSRHEIYSAANPVLKHYLGLIMSWFDREFDQK